MNNLIVRNLCSIARNASAMPYVRWQSIRHEHTSEPAHIKAIVDQISQLKFYEITLLNQALKRELNIPDIQTVQAVGPVVEEAEEEAKTIKTSYAVKITKFDETKKIALIKEVKKLVEGINLVEAKRFVEDSPKVIKSGLSKAEAEELQKLLQEAGATIELE